MPSGYHLDPGEVIVRRINRSIIDLVPVIISGALIVGAVIAGVYGYALHGDQVAFIPPSVVFGVAALLLVIVALMYLSAIYVYSRNFILVTNFHLIKLEQRGLFNQRTSQLPLSRVQDVSGRRSGFFGTLFDYGVVEIQTAGEQENFIFTNAPHPQLLSDQLLQYHEDFLAAFPNRELP